MVHWIIISCKCWSKSLLRFKFHSWPLKINLTICLANVQELSITLHDLHQQMEFGRLWWNCKRFKFERTFHPCWSTCWKQQPHHKVYLVGALELLIISNDLHQHLFPTSRMSFEPHQTVKSCAQKRCKHLLYHGTLVETHGKDLKVKGIIVSMYFYARKSSNVCQFCCKW